MLSDDVLQVADDPLSPKQPLIEMIVVAVPELPETREQTCCRSGRDGPPLPSALAIPRQRPLDVQQIPLAGDGVTSPVPVAYSVRQPSFRPRKSLPGREQRPPQTPPLGSSWRRQPMYPLAFDAPLQLTQNKP